MKKIVNSRMKINCAAIFLLSSLFACQDKTPADHKLFYGGTILTVDQDFTEVEAIVIKDEMIIATGSYDDLLETYGKQSEQIDLTGKVMLPGFIDAHAHAMTGSMVNYLNEDVGMTKFRTTEEVIAHLKEKAKNTPEGEWISARNWDPAVQDGPSELTIKELNSISTKHPVFIINASGHLAYANEMAFELAGIDKTVQNPPGAEFVKDEDGNLTGVMKNMVAFMQVFQANPASQTVDPGDALNSLLGQWNDVGITTSSDLAFGTATSSAKDADILFEAAKREDFTVRLRTYLMYSVAEEWDKTDYKPGSGNSLARIVGFKMVADGSNQGFTGLQREMYCCHSAHKKSFGLAYMTIDQLKHHALKRAEQGWQLAIHGNGDKGIDHLLYVLEELDSMGYDLKKLRPRIEHASILHDDQIAKMKELNVSASFLIGHVYYWGVFMRDSVFAGEKVQLLARAASLEKEGISYTLHSDYPVTNVNPLEMIEIAVNRKTWKEPNYKIAPNEAVSVESAIRAVTYEAAWQLMSEHEVGSIEVGKYADFVILEEDPRKVEADRIDEIKVVETWMNGKLVYAAK